MDFMHMLPLNVLKSTAGFAAWALTIVACSCNAMCDVSVAVCDHIVSLGAIERLVAALGCLSEEVPMAEVAAGALCILACSSNATCDLIIAAGALAPLASLLGTW